VVARVPGGGLVGSVGVSVWRGRPWREAGEGQDDGAEPRILSCMRRRPEREGSAIYADSPELLKRLIAISREPHAGARPIIAWPTRRILATVAGTMGWFEKKWQRELA